MKQEIEVKRICFDSDEYKLELELRNELLRKPIGLSVYDEDLAKEETDYHIGAFLNGVLVGCLVLTPISDEEIKMRQVAVRESLQGFGIGKKLVAYSERVAQEHGYSKIILNARIRVAAFYKKLEYEPIGEAFIEDMTGIPHFKMFKHIAAHAL